MKLDDITVEVRNRNLDRVGQIRPEELDLELQDTFNNVGQWTLRIAAEHPLARVLRTSGSGIIVTGPTDVLMSGPVVEPQNEATATDPLGTVVISGVTDSVLLMDSLAYGDPTAVDVSLPIPIFYGGSGGDTRTGPVETLMHAFVNANIGPAAPADRRADTLLAKITMGADGARGPNTTKTAKYTVLGTLLAELASTTNIGFRIVQRGAGLVFETYAVADRTDVIRLDIFNSTLSGHKVATSPPAATRVIVSGKDLVDDDPDKIQIRNWVMATTDASLAAESEWGRRIEVYKDQSNSDSREELEQAGLEELADKGFTTLAVQAVPMEDSSMPYGTAWAMGDKVAVVVEGQELSAVVSGFILKANADGFRLGATIGDPTGFNRGAATLKRIATVETRVAKLETVTAATASSTAVKAEQSAAQLATLPVRMAAGKATITPSTVNVAKGIVISFPAGRFTDPPVVTATADESAPQTVDVSVTGASATSFNLWLTKTNLTTTFVHWIAVQPF